jgi:hypothetical protein
MKRIWSLILATLITGLCVVTAMSQPPEGKDKGGFGKKGGPPPFELGKVLPPFVRDELELTPEQEKQIAALEGEVKEKLSKILTADQKKKIESTRPMGKDGPPPKGGREGKDGPPKDKDKDQARTTGGGIQWFPTWDAGVAEASRTGRPILLVSAAPHCAGVSGIW